MFNWKKHGKIFDPRAQFSWMQEYAQNPNALVLKDRVRVYFTCRPSRDENNSCVSYIGFVDLDRNDLSKVIYVHNKPVMELGSRGDFDEFGIMPGSIVHLKDRNEIWLYYVGWTRQYSVPYKWSNGLAISRDGGISFEKIGKGPIMTSTLNEPYLQACPRVWQFAPDNWRMWYQTGVEWYEHDGHMESVYITASADSKDGINWNRDGKQVIPSKVFKESQTSPSLLYHQEKYHMFFSYRHGTDFRNSERGYRIGYAASTDMMNWKRDDTKAGLDVSETGWDSEMVCYPHVVEIDQRVYMFYCGNYFGREGFGYAELITDK